MCSCYVTALAVQVPFLNHRSYTVLPVAPQGGADIFWMDGFLVAKGAGPGWAMRASARQELPATASPLGAARLR